MYKIHVQRLEYIQQQFTFLLSAITILLTQNDKSQQVKYLRQLCIKNSSRCMYQLIDY